MAEAFTRWTRSEEQGLCPNVKNPTFNVGMVFLFYEAIRIIKEMREKTNGTKPRYTLWENVPGAFSSNKGEDFKKVLKKICTQKIWDLP